MINETVRRPGMGATPLLTRDRSTGRNPSLLVVFVSSTMSTKNWTTGNIYTLGLTLSLCVTSISPLRHLPFYGTSQSKVAHQVASTAPDGIGSLNVVYFPQLGRAMITRSGMPDTTSFTGFLICVPMLEEWSDGGQIDDLDGWTFQVRDVYYLLSVYD
jgi:hypothetical protein